MMRLSCQERLLPGDTLLERWDAAQRAGFDGIELLGRGDFGLHRRLPELRSAASNGVVFSSVCVSMDHFIGDFDAGRRRDAVANVRSQLSVIAALGGVGVVTPAAYGMFTRKLPPFAPPPRTEEEDHAVLAAVLGELSGHAATEGVAVLFEPLNRYEDHMVNRLDQGAAIIEHLEHRGAGVRLVADSYHMNIEEDTPADAIRQAGSLIGHVQLGDSARWQPGTGHFDFAEFVAALAGVGFDGWLALECNLRGDPTAALAQAAATMRPLIEGVPA